MKTRIARIAQLEMSSRVSCRRIHILKGVDKAEIDAQLASLQERHQFVAGDGLIAMTGYRTAQNEHPLA